MREPDVALQTKTPLCYAWIDHHDHRTVIYVGMSGKGLIRPINYLHRAYGQGSILRVWYCSSVHEAQLLEKELIRELKPTLNINLVNSESEFQTKSKIQTRELVSWQTNPVGAKPFEHPRGAPMGRG